MKGSADIVAEMKCLGYHAACNGDAARNRCVMTGALRGKLAAMDKRFAKTSMAAKAHWWKLQCRGIIRFNAAFVGCNEVAMPKLQVINNAGARKSCKTVGVSPSYNF